MKKYTTQIASDVVRDGLGLELWDEKMNVQLAEIFRFDGKKMIVFNSFSNEIPLDIVEKMIRRAKETLEPFEDGGTILGSANELDAPAI